MASDYEAIKNDNIYRRGAEFDDIGEWISEQFYTDRTHFIYELLQNAEDALARRNKSYTNSDLPNSVDFRLHHDSLVVIHYGQLFDEDDVCGISDILRGTKRKDLTQIGKFGIGFKSVYAFTASPEIHSGDEHFRIERYIRPCGIDPIQQHPGETSFILPFNHGNVDPQEAYNLIKNRLKKLGLRTLLFLRNIDTISWEVTDSDKGIYIRESQSIRSNFARRVSLISETDDGIKSEEWLVFERNLRFDNHEQPARVEIAFRLLIDENTGTEFISSINDSCLVVFFPTEKETHLGFLIQGPYRTTPARDNVPQDDEFNSLLIDETAKLMADALPILRDMGLLNVQLLKALPIVAKKFPESGMFRPIFEVVKDTLLNRNLLPTFDNKFVAGRNAKLARGSELRKLITEKHLQLLFETNNTVRWLTDEITYDKTPNLRQYLMEELDIEEIDPEKFGRQINEAFIKNQSDEWMIRFYEFLNGQKSLWTEYRHGKYSWQKRSGVLRNKRFIRLNNNKHIAPFDNEGRAKVYLPTEIGSDYPTVKRSIADDPEALTFLKKLGLREPDIVDEVIQKILPKYHDLTVEEIKDYQHNKDILKIIQAWEKARGKKHTQLEEEISKTKFLRAINAKTRQRDLRTPSDIYCDTKELRIYFEDNPDGWFLDYYYHRYQNELCSLGVNPSIKISHRQPDYEGHVILRDYYADHERSLNGFDPYAEIEGLKFAVNKPTIDRSLLIWNKLLMPNSHLIRGIVQKSSRQDFSRSQEKEVFSKMGKLLINNAWLPNKKGGFHKPHELSLNDLPDEFYKDNTLAKQLQLKLSSIGSMAKELELEEDFLQEIVNIAKEAPELILDLIQKHKQKIEKTPEEEKDIEEEFDYVKELQQSFNRKGIALGYMGQDIILPPSDMVDPNNRRTKTKAEIQEEKITEPPKISRFKKVPSRIWEDKNSEIRPFLREQYEGCCQICKSTFLKRNGEPYFEGLYLVSRTQKRWIDRSGNVLCLCANCCAKFLHGPVEAADVIDQILEFKPIGEGGHGKSEIKIKLCGEEVAISYSERHMLDLQEMIKASTENSEI